jgi:hypothetical protein
MVLEGLLCFLNKTANEVQKFMGHERTTTAKNMGILKYHPTSLVSYERGWTLACLEDLIKRHIFLSMEIWE